MADNFRSNEIGLRAQKKILGKMSTKGFAKMFIDETASNLLDNVYQLAKQYSGNKKEAEKIVKNTIKIVIKLAILYRNEQFSQEEIQIAFHFKERFHSTAMAIISMYEVDYSYDRNYLLRGIQDSCTLMKQLVRRHLTDKSIARIDMVFGFFGRACFLDTVFKKNSEYRELMGKIVTGMNKALDEGGM